MGRTDRVARQLRRRLAERLVQEVCRLARHDEQVRFPGGSIMRARRREQVTHVIRFELQRILEWLAVRMAFALTDEHRRVQVAIGALGFGKDRNDLVKALVQVAVLGHGEHRARGFEPFVEIAVIERRTAVAAFRQARGDAEVLEIVAVVRALHQLSHAWYHLPAAQLKAVRPKAACPLHFVEANRLHLGKRTRAGISHNGNRRGASDKAKGSEQHARRYRWKAQATGATGLWHPAVRRRYRFTRCVCRNTPQVWRCDVHYYPSISIYLF